MAKQFQCAGSQLVQNELIYLAKRGRRLKSLQALWNCKQVVGDYDDANHAQMLARNSLIVAAMEGTSGRFFGEFTIFFLFHSNSNNLLCQFFIHYLLFFPFILM